jgi:hypothetical protein
VTLGERVAELEMTVAALERRMERLADALEESVPGARCPGCGTVLEDCRGKFEGCW